MISAKSKTSVTDIRKAFSDILRLDPLPKDRSNILPPCVVHGDEAAKRALPSGRQFFIRCPPYRPELLARYLLF